MSLNNEKNASICFERASRINPSYTKALDFKGKQ
jgi:hypothetical protein